MTKEEFRKRMEEFYIWTSQQERPAHSWFCSLMDYSTREFNREYDKYYNVKKGEANGTAQPK